MKALVVIPTYNEIESLPTALDRVREHAPEADILVVDDGSPDGTGDYADTRADEDSHIHVLHRSEKNGLGPAYLAGFSWALAAGYELIVEMDADGSHRAEDLALLIQRAEMADEPDLVIGSRWVSGGATEGWDAKRVALSKAGNLYINAMLGLRVKDATAGFRVFRASILRRMDLGKVEALGYGFQVNMTKLVDEIGGRRRPGTQRGDPRLRKGGDPAAWLGARRLPGRHARPGREPLHRARPRRPVRDPHHRRNHVGNQPGQGASDDGGRRAP